eukprot:2284627-Heterocapsa_arctica.AAC.1
MRARRLVVGNVGHRLGGRDGRVRSHGVKVGGFPSCEFILFDLGGYGRAGGGESIPKGGGALGDQ